MSQDTLSSCAPSLRDLPRLNHTMPFAVQKSQVTSCGALKPFHILNMLQNAADGAVEAMRLPDDYWTNGCGWMLVRYSMRFDRPLCMGMNGFINTGHHLSRDLYSHRRFVLCDSDGNPFGLADSQWVYVDLAARRPQRLSRRLPGEFMKQTENSFDPLFTDPLKPERVDRSVRLRVRLGELDMNGHVNNAYYLSWASEGVPLEVYRTCGIVSAHIAYKHEAVYGAVLNVTTQQDGLTFRHEIHDDGGKLVAVMNVEWAETGVSVWERAQS